MGVSENKGTPKSSMLIGYSIINHPFWGIPIFFGNTHIYKLKLVCFSLGIAHLQQNVSGDYLCGKDSYQLQDGKFQPFHRGMVQAEAVANVEERFWCLSSWRVGFCTPSCIWGGFVTSDVNAVVLFDVDEKAWFFGLENGGFQWIPWADLAKIGGFWGGAPF